ncbi:MAG: threonine--tRNA ligase [Candidatus Micrarchaeota archaeon]|nr:threonine--tRNA ligase [Candidatus Micrarchaeota archaeon]MDE1805028.1 threonine--tRNA ligase [Candidatus Micrarchaeota archaeon]MDE1847246.1 threonine--tRNA ligase [Candidatus Micrarchaeota archaeon]
MRILQQHVEYIEYEPVKKEIASAEEAEKKKVRHEDIVVLFTTVEKGDDQETARKAIDDAGKFLKNLGKKNVLIYPYAHLSSNLARPEIALSVLNQMESRAKELGLMVHKSPFGWNKQYALKIKGHPLAEQSRSYSSVPAPEGGEAAGKAVKHEAQKEELSQDALFARIQKSDFSTLPETDHRIIGERLNLFSFQEVSPGMVYWHNNGIVLFNTLKSFMREKLAEKGYIEISTPTLANTALWRVSGHSEHYKENMFLTMLGEEEFGLKPMNCPATFLVYRSRKWSYKDLPLKISIFDALFRNELSGVASGLFRVKMLTQDDAHIFTTKQGAQDQIVELLALMEEVYRVFGVTHNVRLSTMPEDHMGTAEEWAQATSMLTGALDSKKIKYTIYEKDGAFYGPKIDIDIKDSLGREWQCCTIQADMQMPKKFRLSYTGEDGKEHTPVVLHRTIIGALERFIGILIEHYQGKFPVWLAPVQARVMSISESSNAYAQEVYAKLRKAGVRSEIDVSDKTLEYKIRDAQLMKVPYMLVVGAKEVENKTLAVRTRSGGQKFGVKPEEFIEKIRVECENKAPSPN